MCKKELPLNIAWLQTMLWGGVIALAVEHIAHREIVFYLTFLTAMQNPAEIPLMLKELATIGIPMTSVIIFEDIRQVNFISHH